jgi:hypothetical protein
MTKDEALAWLSEDERKRYALCVVSAVFSNTAADHATDLESLAETRSALARVVEREYATDGPCAFCERHRYEDHAPGCLYDTMPKPPTGTTEDKQSARARADVQERED